MDETPLIVVGVDGSRGSRLALAHALTVAARDGGRVRAVTVFDRPSYRGEGDESPAPPTAADREARLRSVLTDVRIGLGAAAATAPVEVVAVPGAPARVLVEQSEGADELIVGHRGRGAPRSAVPGSVGLQCVMHAPCRVTVVRPPRARELEQAARGPAAAVGATG